MKISNVKFILTDIEGTTTSVSFVYEQLFPYFRNNIYKIKDLIHLEEVKEALEQTQKLASEENIILENIDEQIAQLLKWSLEDKKITPLKTLQGILWEEGYASGEIKGHVYPDVAQALENWKSNGIDLGVFSSGSVAAQKLIFGYSLNGDLTPYFSAYFDTKTGGKRDEITYRKIAEILEIQPETILFLSDIVEELQAAKAAGFQTIQLVRSENTANWEKSVLDFSEIIL
jgi:enolase-phosphatase E1